MLFVNNGALPSRKGWHSREKFHLPIYVTFSEISQHMDFLGLLSKDFRSYTF